MTISIKVICAGWLDGSGWSYTDELDGFTVDSLDQLHEAAEGYVREAAESPTYNASEQVAYALDDGNYSIMGYIREV